MLLDRYWSVHGFIISSLLIRGPGTDVTQLTHQRPAQNASDKRIATLTGILSALEGST